MNLLFLLYNYFLPLESATASTSEGTTVTSLCADLIAGETVDAEVLCWCIHSETSIEIFHWTAEVISNIEFIILHIRVVCTDSSTFLIACCRLQRHLDSSQHLSGICTSVLKTQISSDTSVEHVQPLVSLLVRICI